MLWVNFSNEGGAWQRIFDFGTDQTNYIYVCPRTGVDGPMHTSMTTPEGKFANFDANSKTLASGWHHLAVIIEPDNLQLYLDSEVVGKTSGLYALSDLGVTTNNWLGRSQYPADAFFKGSMDDLRIYDYAMSQAEVTAVYAGEEEQPTEKEAWAIDVSEDEYAPREFEPEKEDQYYVPLRTEHDPKKEQLLRLEALDIACRVLSGSKLPEQSQTWFERGNIYANLHGWDKAVADYTKAIEFDPNNAHYWHMRGVCYLQLGEPSKAVADYTKAIELDPDGERGHYWSQRARAYQQLAQYEKAHSDFTKAIELNPNNANVHYRRALAHLGMGDTEGYRNRCVQMLEHFGQTADVAAAHWVAWTCALAIDAAEDFNHVVELAEFAVEEGKTDQNLTTLGAVLYWAGRLDEAVQKLSGLASEWEQGKELPTHSSPAYTWFFLAMAHHQLGHANESQRYFELALERAEQEMTGDALWNRKLTLQLLRAEVESLLGVSQEILPNEKEVGAQEEK